MPMAYKVYVTMLVQKLRKETEMRRMTIQPDKIQKGTIDNIYVINYLINRQIERRAGNLSAMFVDFKAAFDSVDKKDNEIEAMRERRVREGLTIRVEQVLRETKSSVRLGGEKASERFGE